MDTGSIPVWLAIIAVATAIQVTVILAAGLVMFMLYRRTTQAIERIEQRHLEPLMARITATIDEVKDVVVRVQDADDKVRHVLSRTSETATDVAHAVRVRVSPVMGLGRGVWAAIASFRGQRVSAARPSGREAERGAGFAYEGGASHVRR